MANKSESGRRILSRQRDSAPAERCCGRHQKIYLQSCDSVRLGLVHSDWLGVSPNIGPNILPYVEHIPFRCGIFTLGKNTTLSDLSWDRGSLISAQLRTPVSCSQLSVGEFEYECEPILILRIGGYGSMLTLGCYHISQTHSDKRSQGPDKRSSRHTLGSLGCCKVVITVGLSEMKWWCKRNKEWLSSK